MWMEGFPVWEGGSLRKITTASFNAKLSCSMYKKIYKCKHILLYNYYSVYAYFIMDILCIYVFSFIYFNKHYIVILMVLQSLVYLNHVFILNVFITFFLVRIKFP